MPSRRSPASSSDVPDRRASAMTRWPASFPSTASATTTEPASRTPASRADAPICDVTKSAPPTTTLRPSMVPATPSPGVSTTSAGIGQVHAARPRRRDDRLRDRVLGRLVERRREAQDLVLGRSRLA